MAGESMANLTVLMLGEGDQKVKFEDMARGVAYVSDQTHASAAKGLRILEFRNELIRKVDSDDHFRLDAAALKQLVVEETAAGPLPVRVA